MSVPQKQHPAIDAAGVFPAHPTPSPQSPHLSGKNVSGFGIRALWPRRGKGKLTAALTVSVWLMTNHTFSAVSFAYLSLKNHSYSPNYFKSLLKTRCHLKQKSANKIRYLGTRMREEMERKHSGYFPELPSGFRAPLLLMSLHRTAKCCPCFPPQLSDWDHNP